MKVKLSVQNVDYLKLSEQYASFLVAIGGVSITVLSILLTFNSKANAILAATLVVATISCFTGAHMMAETAAFISYSKGKPSGERLFLLASTNIFIAIILVIFALMLLPIVSGRVEITNIKPISGLIFLFVIIAALRWMAHSVKRMPTNERWRPIIKTSLVSIVWFLFLLIFKNSFSEWGFITIIFSPIIIFTLFSLLRFAGTFDDGGKVVYEDMRLFSLAITSTCASLAAAAIQPLFYE